MIFDNIGQTQDIKKERLKVDFEKQAGTVAWFSARKGFGFITPDDPLEKKDIFVHFTGISMEGYKQLQEGQKVEYILQDSPKGVIAVEVKVLEPAPESE